MQRVGTTYLDFSNKKEFHSPAGKWNSFFCLYFGEVRGDFIIIHTLTNHMKYKSNILPGI